MDERELQNPENWDFEKADVRPGVKKSRAVVSVAFTREDFELVARAAEEFGMKVSEFIRAAALDRAQPNVVVFGAFAAKTESRYSIVPEKEENVASARSSEQA